MVIESTVNISLNKKQKIEFYSNKLNISKNELILKLLFKYLSCNLNNYKTFTRIQYQKKDQDGTWKKIHVWFSTDFYEKCLDLRKFHKLSISYILSIAIDLYLSEIINDQDDNYRHNYIFMSTIFNNCPIFIITWDYPGNKKALQLLNLYNNT